MRTTSCKTLEPKVSAHVDGELPPAEREEVEAHLARCESCARIASGFREIDRLAGGQTMDPVASAEWASFRERLTHRIETAPRGKIIPGLALRRWALAAAAAVLIGLAGAWILLPDKAPPLESFAEWRSGPPPAQIEVDDETLYIKYDF